jgi:ribonucleoside-diphosphate reductase alpha chain
MSGARERLAYRRAAETFAIEAGGLHYTATVGHFDDGRLAEIFLTSNKIGSAAATAACDAAVLCSIALQHGVPLDVLRHALMRDAAGRAIGPLGVVLDRIAEEAAYP